MLLHTAEPVNLTAAQPDRRKGVESSDTSRILRNRTQLVRNDAPRHRQPLNGHLLRVLDSGKHLFSSTFKNV
jgi:hypothetical protein